MREMRAGTPQARHFIATLLSTLLFSTSVFAQAQGPHVTAMWDASPPADQVTGYEVCLGTSSMSCNVQLAAVPGSQTSYTFTPVGGTIHYVSIRAVNAGGVGTFSPEVTFSVPSFTQPLNQSSPVGTAITPVNLSVNDPDGSTVNFTHAGLPTGLSLSATTGRITGTPSAAGTYNVTVFVADNLATISRSWVWTITSGSSDTLAPTLATTSHTSGQTVTSANVTIRGTATDSGRGGSGITTVRVNGVAATGGTATGSNTASWSRGLTLAPGSNIVTIEAIDGAGNLSMQQLTLTANLAIAPATGATLSPSLASPRNTGTAITFTALGSGGVGPLQYKFLVAQGAGAAQTVRNWSTTATYAWTPTTAASYTVSVWVRSAGVTVDAAQASAQVAYTINTPAPSAVTSASISASVASPQGTGAPITFSASASGGVGPRQYKFLMQTNGGAAQMVRNWSTATTYAWTPAATGSYTVLVWARSAGVTIDAAQASAQMSYNIAAPGVNAISSTPSSGSGSSQTFTLQVLRQPWRDEPGVGVGLVHDRHERRWHVHGLPRARHEPRLPAERRGLGVDQSDALERRDSAEQLVCDCARKQLDVGQRSQHDRQPGDHLQAGVQRGEGAQDVRQCWRWIEQRLAGPR